MENNGTLTVRLNKQENKTYLPGDTVAGSMFVGSCPVNRNSLVMRCGNHNGTCDVRFTVGRADAIQAMARGDYLYCPGCADQTVKEIVRETQHKKTMTIRRAKQTAKQIVLAAVIPLAGPKLRDEFTYPEIVLAAWRLDPVRFGLPGHEGEHPDSNRVKMELCASRDGTLMDLYLERPRANVYRFTAEGRGRIEREQRRAEHERKTQAGGRV